MDGLAVLLGSQQVFQIVLCNVNTLYIALHQLHGGFPAQLPQLALQHPDAGFLGVGGDDPPDGVVGDAQLRALHAVLLELLGQQMLLGDLQLFLIRV